MREILHIVTAEKDTLAEQMISRHSADAQNRVTVADLTRSDANYEELLQAIFAADSIQVW